MPFTGCALFIMTQSFLLDCIYTKCANKRTCKFQNYTWTDQMIKSAENIAIKELWDSQTRQTTYELVCRHPIQRESTKTHWTDGFCLNRKAFTSQRFRWGTCHYEYSSARPLHVFATRDLNQEGLYPSTDSDQGLSVTSGIHQEPAMPLQYRNLKH